MGKKGLTSILSKLVDPTAPSPAEAAASWPWPSCRNPQTASFRAGGGPSCTTGPAAKLCRPDDVYRTVNSVYFDSADSSFGDDDDGELLHDAFSASSVSEESSEAVIRSLGRASTDRLFFDPGPANSLARAPPPPDADEPAPRPPPSMIEESVALAVDSDDPYRDFRSSMEEMVAAHGLRDWDGLQELLVWYLRINGKSNHAFILGAFVDLLVGLATSLPPATTTPTTTSTTTTSGATTTTTTTTEQCSSGTDASCSSASCITLEKTSDHGS